jgi:hypothetical protein
MLSPSDPKNRIHILAKLRLPTFISAYESIKDMHGKEEYIKTRSPQIHDRGRHRPSYRSKTIINIALTIIYLIK